MRDFWWTEWQFEHVHFPVNIIPSNYTLLLAEGQTGEAGNLPKN